MNMLIVKNWGRFQHFKDRDPVWIKLYRSILTDPDVMSLTPRAFRTLVLLWLVAARGNGALPDLDSIRFHLRDADIDGGDLALLVEKGFLEEADMAPGGKSYVRKSIPMSVRFAVMARDGAKCVLCGNADAVELDHIVPRSLGGASDESNLRVLCRRCSRRKHAYGAEWAPGTDSDEFVPGGSPREEGEEKEEKRETFGPEPESRGEHTAGPSPREDAHDPDPEMRSDAPVASPDDDPQLTPFRTGGGAGRGRGARNPGNPAGRRPVTELVGPDSSPDDPVLAEFPCVGGKSLAVRFGWVGQFRGTYPAIDLAQETLKAQAWVISNPTKRKTPGGMARFLTGWYSRAQDDAKGAGRGRTRTP